MRILLADSDEMVLEPFEKSLKLDKHIVDIAKDGMEAFEKAMHNAYDTILMDIVLPMKSGVDVCKDLRNKEVHTPIIIISSKGHEDSTIQGLDAGADDYVQHSVGYPELEARIRAINRRPRHMQPKILTAGPLNLDTAKRIIKLDGKVLELRPKEYAMLAYLIEHAGIVVPKDELLKNIWSVSANNASNRLEVCVCHIRSKFTGKNQNLLKTVRGHGYVIEP